MLLRPIIEILGTDNGRSFTATENEELHMIISKNDKDMNKIKMSINYDTNHMRHRSVMGVTVFIIKKSIRELLLFFNRIYANFFCFWSK